MSSFAKLKIGVAGLALATAAGAADAQSTRELARRERAAEAATQPASANSLSARDACKQIATTNFNQLPATGKAFATGGDLGCEFTRVGNDYTVTRTYDLANPAQAQGFDRSLQTANRMEQAAQQRQNAQQQREDRQNSPLRQSQEAMREAQQYQNLMRQGQNILRGFGR